VKKIYLSVIASWATRQLLINVPAFASSSRGSQAKTSFISLVRENPSSFLLSQFAKIVRFIALGLLPALR